MKRKLRKLCKILFNTLLPGRRGAVCYYNQLSLRWYFTPYGQERLGDVGCGPVVCAMAASTLLDRPITPAEAARWAFEEGFYEYHHGSLHSLIPAFCAHHGLACRDLGSSMDLLAEKLEDRRSCGILLCRQGIFSGGRHFVLVTREEGRFRVYNSANVLTLYRRFTPEQLEDALAKENIYIGPIWWISQENTP